MKVDKSDVIDEHFAPLDGPVNKRRIIDEGTGGEKGTDKQI